MNEGSWTIEPFSREAVAGLARGLRLSQTTAAVLARRGYDDIDSARAFLEGALPAHDPFELGDMRAACEAIRGAIAAGRRICVHGDYDADGICATALAVLILRRLGADVEWHLPSRFDEGYGVQEETLSRLAADGCGLVLTVDCGITATAEVAAASELGLEVVVTDHHRPAETLPACPLVGPYRDSAYPFGDLCGTGVVFKLGQALLGEGCEGLHGHLERYHRPVVLIAGGEREWKGSGRSTGAFDLHGGLAACSDHLARFGGHRAAAGLSIEPSNVDAFAASFAEHADQHLAEAELRPLTVVDALVHGSQLTLDLCAELARLAPFGLGNPGVTLLVAGCSLSDVAAVGDGKHLRFRVKDGARDAGSAIAFGFGRQLDRFRQEARFDIAFRLEENQWNGTVAPQLVVRRVFDGEPRYRDLRDWLVELWRSGKGSWPAEAAAIFAELELENDPQSRGHLLESATFRRLLEAPPNLAEAA